MLRKNTGARIDVFIYNIYGNIELNILVRSQVVVWSRPQKPYGCCTVYVLCSSVVPFRLVLVKLTSLPYEQRVGASPLPFLFQLREGVTRNAWVVPRTLFLIDILWCWLC
jgi:hypothetical protein